ncbi:hypothetical protein RHGRI_001539 [Rhododendron griersonianum]|uniref:Uncharacterized protein n=1 Tax=Rhododendron griersonianum TaxID=479676 RepID=A0AAV6LL32_9ERIC|nr:hypothetical protein RHGRI_001539 [Rhododendron griersonianum]
MKVIVLMLVFILIAMCWQIVKGESKGKNGHLLNLALVLPTSYNLSCCDYSVTSWAFV